MGRWDDEKKQQSPPTTYHTPHSATLDPQLPPPPPHLVKPGGILLAQIKPQTLQKQGFSLEFCSPFFRLADRGGNRTGGSMTNDQNEPRLSTCNFPPALKTYLLCLITSRLLHLMTSANTYYHCTKQNRPAQNLGRFWSKKRVFTKGSQHQKGAKP